MIREIVGDATVCYRGGDGSAAPLVLLHGGGLDSAATTWEPVWNELAGSGPVVAPDLPGFGGTPLTIPATIESYAGWVVRLLDELGVQRFVLAGLSLGGGVGLEVAALVPDRVLGLGLISPYGISARTPGGRLGWLLVHLPGTSGATNVVLRHSRAAVRASLAALLRRPGTLTEDVIADVMGLARAPGAGAAWQQFQRDEVRWSGPKTDLRGSLARLTCPVVYLVGEHDIVPPEDVRLAAGRTADAEFRVVAGAGHWLPRDAPAEVCAPLIELRRRSAKNDGG